MPTVSPQERQEVVMKKASNETLFWAILSGLVKDPEEDIVIGWTPAKKGSREGFTYKEILSPEVNSLTTKQILSKCGNHA